MVYMYSLEYSIKAATKPWYSGYCSLSVQYEQK